MTKRDPGLQPQRTVLAWGRTGSCVLVHALLSLRAGIESADRVLQTLGSILLVTSAAIVVLGMLRRDEIDAAAQPSGPATWMMVATVAASCLAAATSCIVVLAHLR